MVRLFFCHRNQAYQIQGVHFVSAASQPNRPAVSITTVL